IRRPHAVLALIEGHWHATMPPEQLHGYTLADIEQLCFRANLKVATVTCIPHESPDGQPLSDGLHVGPLTLTGLGPEEVRQFHSSVFIVRATALAPSDHPL